MSEVPNPEIRTRLEYQGITDGVYQFPSLTVKAISWCTTHNISKDIPNPNPAADRPDDCLLAEYREGECVISRGGPKHDWWVDL